jgi:hypothetical protein
LLPRRWGSEQITWINSAPIFESIQLEAKQLSIKKLLLGRTTFMDNRGYDIVYNKLQQVRKPTALLCG